MIQRVTRQYLLGLSRRAPRVSMTSIAQTSQTQQIMASMQGMYTVPKRMFAAGQ